MLDIFHKIIENTVLLNTSDLVRQQPIVSNNWQIKSVANYLDSEEVDMHT